MKGYWIIFGTDVKDQQAQQEYGRLWAPIAQAYGATIKVLDTGELREAITTSRVLAVEFSSYAQAKACYEDPAYAEAKRYALQASSRELLIIEADLA